MAIGHNSCSDPLDVNQVVTNQIHQAVEVTGEKVQEKQRNILVLERVRRLRG